MYVCSAICSNSNYIVYTCVRIHAALNTCVPWPLSLPAQQELLKELELYKRRLHEESRARREAEERALEVQPLL